MRSFICLCILFVGILKLASTNLTTCEKSQQHFADMCFSPTPAQNLDFQWFAENQPAEGWYVNIGNDVEQFHFSEIVKKEVLNRTDDFSELCGLLHIDHTTGDGSWKGFGGLFSKWVCNTSSDFPGTQRCDVQIKHSKFHEDVLAYISFQDQKTKIAFAIHCFPNGQVGWLVLSKPPKLTDEEKEIALNHADKLGFTKDTHEILYGDKCSQ